MSNGVHPGVNEAHDIDGATITWANGKGAATSARQFARCDLQGRRSNTTARNFAHHLATIPPSFTGLIDFQWNILVCILLVCLLTVRSQALC